MLNRHPVTVYYRIFMNLSMWGTRKAFSADRDSAILAEDFDDNKCQDAVKVCSPDRPGFEKIKILISEVWSLSTFAASEILASVNEIFSSKKAAKQSLT